MYPQNSTKTEQIQGLTILIAHSIDEIPTPIFANDPDPSNENSETEDENQSSSFERNFTNRKFHSIKDFRLSNSSLSSHPNPYILPSVVLIIGVSLSILAVIFLYQFLHNEIKKEGYTEMKRINDVENSAISSSTDLHSPYEGEMIKENVQEFYLEWKSFYKSLIFRTF